MKPTKLPPGTAWGAYQTIYDELIDSALASPYSDRLSLRDIIQREYIAGKKRRDAD